MISMKSHEIPLKSIETPYFIMGYTIFHYLNQLEPAPAWQLKFQIDDGRQNVDDHACCKTMQDVHVSGRREYMGLYGFN